MENKNEIPNNKTVFKPNVENYESLQLLRFFLPFQIEIKETRNALGFPPNGFTDDKSVSDWFTQAFKDSKTFCESQEFKEQRLKIAKEWADGEIAYNQLLKKEAELFETTPIRNFRSKALKICRHFHLHELFEGNIIVYVLSNKMSEGIPQNWIINQPFDNYKKIEIIIYGTILDSEMKKIVKEAIQINSRRTGRRIVNKPYRTIKKDIQLLRIGNDGKEKSDLEIAEELGKAKRKKEKSVEPGKAGRIISRNRAKYEIRGQLKRKFGQNTAISS